MATYTRAGSFSGTIPGAPRETALRVLDAAGSDATLWTTADRQKTAGPIVYANGAGNVTLYADPGTYTVRWTGGQTTIAVTGGTEGVAEGGGFQPAPDDLWNLLESGQEVLPRDAVTSEYAPDSGTVHLSFFTARRSGTIAKLRTFVTGTAAAGLTAGQVGVYQHSGSTLTRVAASVSDTDLWDATFTAYATDLAASFAMVAGNRYAAAFLAAGDTMPVLEAIAVRYGSVDLAPRIQGELTGQTSLPASIPVASLANSYRRFQGILLP